MHQNGYTLPVHGNVFNETVPFKEDISLEELVKSNTFLSLACCPSRRARALCFRP